MAIKAVKTAFCNCKQTLLVKDAESCTRFTPRLIYAGIYTELNLLGGLLIAWGYYLVDQDC